MLDRHYIEDMDDHFIINPITRKILPATPKKNLLVQLDNNSERFTFEIPRIVEGHDMNECDSIEVHYLNQTERGRDSNTDVYVVTDKELIGDTLKFSWLISNNATRYAGILAFGITFHCRLYDDDYAWHTDIYSNITVASGFEFGASVVEEYSDVLESWRKALFEEPFNYKERIARELIEELDRTLPPNYMDLANTIDHHIVIEDESKVDQYTKLFFKKPNKKFHFLDDDDICSTKDAMEYLRRTR